jgi:hypothetical protein
MLGMLGLTLTYILFMMGLFQFTKEKLGFFKKIGYQYEYPLDNVKYFGLICLGSLGGGLMGGVFALSNSMTIIFTLVYMDVELIVTTAIVGFQVIFFASASLAQAIISNSIPLEVVALFIGLTFVGGGILSFLTDKMVSKLKS